MSKSKIVYSNVDRRRKTKQRKYMTAIKKMVERGANRNMLFFPNWIFIIRARIMPLWRYRGHRKVIFSVYLVKNNLTASEYENSKSHLPGSTLLSLLLCLLLTYTHMQGDVTSHFSYAVVFLRPRWPCFCFQCLPSRLNIIQRVLACAPSASL